MIGAWRHATGYPSYTWLDNRLVPFSAGNATLTATFGNTSRSTDLVVKDTFRPGWPQATAISDTSALIAANMTDAFTVKFQLLPSASLGVPLGSAGLLNASDVLQRGEEGSFACTGRLNVLL